MEPVSYTHLDLFCIVTLKLNVAGAAYATVISQGISAVLCLIYMYRKFTILRTRKSDYYIDRVTTAQMMGLGIPMALNYSLIAVGSMILQSAVNVFGSSAVAAFTAASKAVSYTHLDVYKRQVASATHSKVSPSKPSL